MIPYYSFGGESNQRNSKPWLTASTKEFHQYVELATALRTKLEVPPTIKERDLLLWTAKRLGVSTHSKTLLEIADGILLAWPEP